MVQARTTVSAVSALAAAAVVGAQITTTASLFEAIFDSVALSGSVEGVGADGTTYVLSAVYTVDSEDDTTIALPITMTLVEDATHVSEVVQLSVTGLPTDLGVDIGVMSVGAECDIVNGEARCTEHAVQGTLVSTDNVETLAATLGPVPVVLPAAATSQSNTASTPTASSPGATSTTSGAMSRNFVAKSLVGCVSIVAALAMWL